MPADTLTEDHAAPDYRSTVFLPETEFPMRAGLPQREPEWLARWDRLGVYDRLRARARRGGSPSCCTMARPMPTGICTSAMR